MSVLKKRIGVLMVLAVFIVFALTLTACLRMTNLDDELIIVRNRILNEADSANIDPLPLMCDMNADGTFKSVEYGADSHINGFITALNKVLIMVQAYCGAENQYFHDEILAQKINLSLKNWAEKDYKSGNWWWNEIAVPMVLSNILIYDFPFFSQGYFQKLVDITNRGLPKLDSHFRSHKTADPGANVTNKIVTALRIGIATNDAKLIKKYVTKLLESELKAFPARHEGIAYDYSFHQHAAQIYNGSYGASFSKDVNALLRYLNGTQFMVTDRAVNFYADFILEGHQYFFRGQTNDFGVQGRVVSRKPDAPDASVETITHTTAEAARVLLQIESTVRKTELNKLLENRIDTVDNQTTMSRHFFNSDFTVAHRPDFYLSVRGSSTRTVKTEMVNGENLRGRLLSEGTTVLMKDGSEYRDIFSVWDWNKIPGTTAVQVESIHLKPKGNEYGAGTFVGGLSDGTTAISAMSLIDKSSNTALNAQKAYFIFNNGYVALGSGIMTNLESQVVTSIEQSNLKGIPEKTDSWVLHNGIGYIVDGNDFTVSAGKQSGNWQDINQHHPSEVVSKDVFDCILTMAISRKTQPTITLFCPTQQRRSWSTGLKILILFKLQILLKTPVYGQ